MNKQAQRQEKEKFFSCFRLARRRERLIFLPVVGQHGLQIERLGDDNLRSCLCTIHVI